MGYIGITRSFHEDGLSFRGLGASSTPGANIKYFAPSSSLHWRNSSWRKTYEDLKALDQQWHNVLQAIANIDLSELPFLDKKDVKMIEDGIDAFSASPMPIVGELALLLQLLGGGRSLDESCVDTLVFAQERLHGVAGYFYGVSGFLGIACGIAAFLPADAGVSAVGLGTAAATSAFTATVALGLSGCAGDIAKGQMPSKSNVQLVTDGATVLAGNAPIGSADRDAARAAFTSTVEARAVEAGRETAKVAAKRKSSIKADACRARGGVFDPKAPSGCRVPSNGQIDATGGKITGAGGDVLGPKGSRTPVSELLVPAGLAVFGVVGVWLLWPKKPRSNPRPRRRRR